MTLKVLELLGDVVCEAIKFAKDKVGISGLEDADRICNAILPDFEHLEEDVEAVARAAYDMAKRVKDTLSS